MKRLIPFIILGFGLAVSACATPDPVSRAAPLDFSPAGQAAPSALAIQAQNWQVSALRVDVPGALTVSEANSIKPRADIVWREDPIGDRHQQVANVMTPPLEAAFSGLQGEVPVQVQLVVTRFHALTEHEVEFDLTVRHAETGALLHGPEHVDLTFRAFGGSEAIAAERQGIFQRDRIQARLQTWVSETFAPAPVMASLTN